MSRNLKNILIFSSSTLVSRVTGLIRDMVMFSFLGTSGLNSAFILAFTLPNLFRRLLGEGALTSALVPIFTEELEENKLTGAFRFLNQVLTRLFVILFTIVTLTIVVLWLGQRVPGLQERWYWGMHFGVLLMPYMLCVCLAALIAAALNVLNRFGAAALSAVWLNLAMVVALVVAGYLFRLSPEGIVYCLCAGVLVGGFLQAFLPGWSLVAEGWAPRWDWSYTPRLMDLLSLFLPGVFGAAIIQINIVVSRLLAFGLDSGGVSILYLANRLVEMPLGLFAIAITSVLFPQLSMSVARRDEGGIAHTYNQGIRLIFSITVPAALGLILLTKPILQLLFQWGRFEAQDVERTCPILAIYALTIPFYAWATFATRGFHSLKDTRSPVKISTALLVINFLLSMTLMHFFGIAGLATANLTTVIVQCVLLQKHLMQKCGAFAIRNFSLRPIVVACGAMALGVLFFTHLLQHLLGHSKWAQLGTLGFVIPFAVVVYGCVQYLFGAPEIKALCALRRKKTVS